MRRAVLVVVAFLLALGGMVVSTPSLAQAAVPVFPEGIRAPRGGTEFIYYLKPGNLIEGEKTRVTLDGVDMTKRGDGVWYLVTERPKNRQHYFIMKMWTSDSEWSGWTKFKKVWR